MPASTIANQAAVKVSPSPRDRPRLTVDLDALARNYARLREASGAAETAAVVKADAYGLGADAVARRLVAEGCATFFVANVEEGARVRSVAPGVRIYVLGGLMAGDAERVLALGLSPVLNEPEQLGRWIAARGRSGSGAAAGLFLDTGMNRLGCTSAQMESVLGRNDLAGDEVDLLVSHFACASTPGHPMNDAQIARFNDLLPRFRARFPGARASLANSGGIFLGPAARFDLTRPGIALYGGEPHEDRSIAMEAVATLEAPILQVRDLAPGDRVGYGADHAVDRPIRAATVALGYADGFLRAGGGRGYGVIAGRRVAIVGRVSMDLMTLDVTHAGEAARPGAFVELLGRSALLDDQAEAAGTANYELLVRLSPRCDRRYSGAAA
jgi:alanine racemase